jgi:menaquinone-dependent protoporphyrinogen oxidase
MSMSTQRFLIVYGTHHGQSALIAQHIAQALQSAGATTLVNGIDLPQSISPRDFDGVIIGGSIQFNQHQRFLKQFARKHRNTLNAMPSAFFSVSGAGAGRTDVERAQAGDYIAEFLRETGWHPKVTASFGGAIAYTRYNPLLRWVMRRIAAEKGGPTDTSRDHSLTDWTQVERFALDFATTVSHPQGEQLSATT